jgi:NAD(P)-dependent dehydrogenase (short-subunit alcohol dehydrogenase family)
LITGWSRSAACLGDHQWALTNSLRTELRSHGTLVVGVHAGFIDTDMTASVTEEKISPRAVA